MPTKMTAVEWLVQYIHSEEYQKAFGQTYISIELVEQAKAMEKEQIIDGFGVGCQVESTRLIGYHKMAEQYYNETFGS